MKGPFQYSGNKLFLVDTVAKLINENMPNYKVYVEPFLGSGSIFYNVPFKDDAKYIINDLDEYVYRMHNSFKSGYSYDQYLKLCDNIKIKFGDIKASKDAYYAFRDAWNSRFNKTTTEEDYFKSGMYLIILASACINSMLRFGPNGMNQSFGNRCRILTEEEYTNYTSRVDNKYTQLLNKDFYKVFEKLTNSNIDNLVMFMDPPYATREMTYNKGFDLVKFIDVIKNPKNYPENCLIMYTDKDNEISDTLLNYGWTKQKIRDMVSTSPNRKQKVEATGEEVMFVLKKGN
jgi:site-specific DNA-adenine methylase